MRMQCELSLLPVLHCLLHYSIVRGRSDSWAVRAKPLPLPALIPAAVQHRALAAGQGR